MKAIRFRITPELLRQSLRLPENTVVRGLYEDPLSPELIWWIVLEGEDFPETGEGAKICEAMATMHVDPALEETYVWDWDVKNG